MNHVIALFGEAEKGRYSQPISIREVAQLSDHLGNPPEESKGIPLAIQALLYNRTVLFFRVREEGFSAEDYLHGLHALEKTNAPETIHALCMPGVGDVDIINAASPLIDRHQSLLIVNEQDLYDYLTAIKRIPS